MARYRVAIWQEWHWWVAQCLDVDVATQGGSESEVVENMQEALLLHFAHPNSSAAPGELHLPGQVRHIEVNLEPG